VLLLEGWCLGARPQADSALAEPVNALEAAEDPEAIWRRHANTALAGDYQRLFARIDRLVFLAAPGWEVVARWREEQEAGLRDAGGSAVMNPAEVARFIQHYERLTRHLLATMPGYADLAVRLGEGREVLGVG
jgi:D-glycerate 3-kinase